MGTWKCKDGQVKIQTESKIMSLTRLVLNEQANEISDEMMDTYVDDAVDDLDGYVAEYNLQSLFNILTALKGKTNNGEDAIKKFLQYYKEDEDKDFVSDVQGVGVANLSVKAKNMKPQIIALANNTSTQPVTPGVTPPVAGKIGLSKIDISWDGEKKDETPVGGGSVGGGSKSGVNYHDCSSKDFPFEFGCISPKIAEIQGCLGITPQKGYFGPKTKRTMEPTYDLSGGITKEIYDAVKAKCGGAETSEPERKKYSDAELAPISTEKIKLSDTTKLGDLTGKVKPIDMGSGSSNNGESIYKMLQSNYGDGSNPEFPYIFSEGGRLKYKGESMGGDAKDQLSQYVATLGYREESIKDKDKGYGVKYVWVKQ
jgi:hypothetical protein